MVSCWRLWISSLRSYSAILPVPQDDVRRLFSLTGCFEIRGCLNFEFRRADLAIGYGKQTNQILG